MRLAGVRLRALLGASVRFSEFGGVGSSRATGPGGQRLPRLDPALEQREGVTIGLEVVNRYESNMLNSTEQESNCGPLGSSTVDFADTFAALDRIGYDGTIIFESPSSAATA